MSSPAYKPDENPRRTRNSGLARVLKLLAPETDGDGETVNPVGAARYSCQLCGGRSVGPVHPKDPETGIPACQMPRLGA